jgi:hypothetical protein
MGASRGTRIGHRCGRVLRAPPQRLTRAPLRCLAPGVLRDDPSRCTHEASVAVDSRLLRASRTTVPFHDGDQADLNACFATHFRPRIFDPGRRTSPTGWRRWLANAATAELQLVRWPRSSGPWPTPVSHGGPWSRTRTADCGRRAELEAFHQARWDVPMAGASDLGLTRHLAESGHCAIVLARPLHPRYLEGISGPRRHGFRVQRDAPRDCEEDEAG